MSSSPLHGWHSPGTRRRRRRKKGCLLFLFRVDGAYSLTHGGKHVHRWTPLVVSDKNEHKKLYTSLFSLCLNGISCWFSSPSFSMSMSMEFQMDDTTIEEERNGISAPNKLDQFFSFVFFLVLYVRRILFSQAPPVIHVLHSTS